MKRRIILLLFVTTVFSQISEGQISSDKKFDPSEAVLNELKQTDEYKKLDSLFKERTNLETVKRINPVLSRLQSEALSTRITEVDGVEKLCFTQAGRLRVLTNVDVEKTKSDPSYLRRRAREITYLILFGFKQEFPEMIFPTSISEQEKDSYDKGIKAAEAGNFKMAANYFKEETFKNGYAYPSLSMYNLGVAESHIPGRELRAISWLAGFMTSEYIINADQIKKQIELLKQRNRNSITKMLVKMQDVVSRFSGFERNTFLTQVAHLWLDIGEPDSVHSIMKLMKADDESLINLLVRAYIQSGDLVMAEILAEQIKNKAYRKKAFIELANAFLLTGDFTETRKKLDQVIDKGEEVEEDWESYTLLSEISGVLLNMCKYYHQSRDTIMLKTTLSSASKIIDRIGSRFLYCQALIKLAETQYVAGYKQMGISSFDMIWKESNGIQSVHDRIIMLTQLVSTRNKLGDVDKIHDQMEKLSEVASFADNNNNAGALAAFAELKIETGDFEGAEKIYVRIENDYSGAAVFYKLIDAYLKADNKQKAQSLVYSSSLNERKDKANEAIREWGRVPGTRLIDWVNALNDKAIWSKSPLGMEIFIDMESFIKNSITSFSTASYSYGIHDLFEKMIFIVRNFINAEKRINLMLANLYEFKKNQNQ